MILNTRTAHTQKTRPVDCDGVQLTNAQCDMVPISILWYKEPCIQLKYTTETQQERITISHYPTHRHGHTNSWYVYVSSKEIISVT